MCQGSFVLENLVDLKKEYKFDNNIPFPKKKTLQLIRKASCTSQPQPENKGIFLFYRIFLKKLS